MTASAASSEDDVKSQRPQLYANLRTGGRRISPIRCTADRGIYKGAIPGMLRTLDPHSNFFDPHDMANMRDDQRGHYYGIGMEVSTRNGKDGGHQAVCRIAGVQGGLAAGRHDQPK